MYVGDPHDGSGLHHLLWEVLANSLDQFLTGSASVIDVTIHADESIEVTDDGAGVSIAPGHGSTFLEWALTSHHSATADGHAPHIHIGSRGVGLAAVCAVCEFVRVEVRTSEGRFAQRFARGRSVSELERVGDPSASGTSVRFKPDPEIFSHTRWDIGWIDRRLRELSALQPGLRTSLRTARRQYGPSDPCTLLDTAHSVLPEPFLCIGREDLMTARIALDWSGFDDPEDEPTILQFSNLERTRDGDHIQGLKRGLVRALNKLGARTGKAWVRPYERLSRGMSAVVSVTLIDPEYGSPTRDLLVHPRVGRLVENTIVQELPPLLNHIPDFRDELLARLRS